MIGVIVRNCPAHFDVYFCRHGWPIRVSVWIKDLNKERGVNNGFKNGYKKKNNKTYFTQTSTSSSSSPMLTLSDELIVTSNFGRTEGKMSFASCSLVVIKIEALKQKKPQLTIFFHLKTLNYLVFFNPSWNMIMSFSGLRVEGVWQL